VISQQVEGVCSEVRGPARRFEIPQVMEDKAAEISKSLANYTGLYGSFAIEFFYTKSGELLVNEIAPRVHNSGHFTQNASPCSQFENHLRAAVGMPLGQTESDQYFSMMNILGPVSYYGKVEAPTLRIPGATLHWYGKEDSRPGRKIGHVNLVAADQDQLRGLLAKIQLSLDAWKSLYTPKSISEDK
jgi:5-(carboxyamino)imidazole ribonucleotide synthase